MVPVLLRSATAGHAMWGLDHWIVAGLRHRGKAAHLFDTFFQAVLISPAHVPA
jgi:hypothetical protein